MEKIDYTRFEGHTPGKWQAIHDDGGELTDEGYVQARRESWTIDGPRVHGLLLAEEMAEPDARLIAAAPELLARCKALEEAAVAVVEAHGRYAVAGAFSAESVWTDVEAALAKLAALLPKEADKGVE